MSKHYTPDQLREMARKVHGDTHLPCDLHVIGKMLRQAASDAARIAELEADAERLNKGWDQAVEALDAALEDAERWRWLVAENNKGGSRAKFLICWWSKVADGYETTNGTSIDGKDEQAIVRLIDAARSRT
ncbi:hypothetical protein [Luteibacter sp. SG786]|uniref:hypothetical protein n=1 Tax=Luteibacter sp. SG786 TaxID=2587130 RepID=UPI00142376BF|nr:hypothetical protein [Luteibacter sp. SG786]NII54356.1 hypothetical protein [Luteibacter sp. SG786]